MNIVVICEAPLPDLASVKEYHSKVVEPLRQSIRQDGARPHVKIFTHFCPSLPLSKEDVKDLYSQHLSPSMRSVVSLYDIGDKEEKKRALNEAQEVHILKSTVTQNDVDDFFINLKDSSLFHKLGVFTTEAGFLLDWRQENRNVMDYYRKAIAQRK